MTYHGVTLFAIPEFKSLEVLKKIFFALILLSINPKNNPKTNPDLNYKEKNSKKKTLTQKYKIDVTGFEPQTAAWKTFTLTTTTQHNNHQTLFENGI